jgi:hypothetical protein
MWTKDKMSVKVAEAGEAEPVEYNLIDELQIRFESIEELVELLSTQDQKALYWGGTAIREAERFNKFESINLKQWRAHCNRYAKLIMKGRKDTVTISGISEVVAEIFCKEVLGNEKLSVMYAIEVCNVMFSAKEEEDLKLQKKYEGAVKEVRDKMYRYSQSYEEIMNMYCEMESDKNLLALVADTFKARGYSLSSIKQVTVGLEGEGFQVPRKIVESLENVAKQLQQFNKK